MTPERWRKVKAVLEDVLECAAEERTAHLKVLCQEDDDLRCEVESLLAFETEVCDFIETPVFRIRTEDVLPRAEGQRIGPYRLVREIGRGGMGAVYLAERADEEFERRVALKLIRRGMDTDEIVRRFHSERQILAHLDHFNIAKLLDGGTTEDGRPYFVMEYVEGQPLDDYCDSRGLTTRERLELFRQVCSAVHFAHQNLIVHRDLKPGNILVTADGVPKLLDFGIAKLLNPEEEQFAFTRVDLRPMTPEYASPEQVRGEAVSTASDVYSLGVLLYALLTGCSPYQLKRSDPQGLARAICEDNPIRPSSAWGHVEPVRTPEATAAELTSESRRRSRDPRLLRRELTGDLDNIVLKAMSKEPQRRYASVHQLANDIERHLQGLPVIARKDTLAYRTSKLVSRHRVGVSVAVAVFFLIIGFAITVTVLLGKALDERRRAEGEKARAEAVAAFLEKLFSVPDPRESRGDTVTAREVLDKGAREIHDKLKDQPALQADLMETMGRVYREIGLFEPARELLASSLRLRRALKQDDLTIARNLHNLAGVLHDQGNDMVSEVFIREALEIERRRGSTEDIDYAKGLSNLGELLAEKGRLDEAEALLKVSLAIKRRLPGVEKRDIANSLNNLGRIRCTRSDYASCERYYREALEIRRELAGGLPDPDLATSLNNLASLLDDLGEPADAESLYREVLRMRRGLFGDRSPRVARTLNNLAFVLQRQGMAARAVELYRQAISIADATLGRNHFERAIYLRNLATALLTLGHSAEAESKAREAVTIFRATKPDSWRVADAESVLGSCLAAQGRYEDAEPFLTSSYALLAKDRGGGAKHASDALDRIVDLYKAWGKPEKAAAARAAGAGGVGRGR